MTLHSFDLRRAMAVAVALSLLAGLLPFAAAPTKAVSADLVISQIYGGGGNSGATYTHDYIEIFNRGSSSVSLVGQSLQYASATGTGFFGASNTQLTELTGLIPPGGYRLVQQATNNAAVGAPLPTPDITDATPINMSGTAGKVALVMGTSGLGCNGGSTPCEAGQLARIIDLVGYGNADFFEGAGAAPTLSSTTAALRAGGGCTEMDNNASDFSAVTPTPRNSATPITVCDASTDPSGVGSATPASVPAGANSLLSVTVTPGANPPSTGLTVTVDLTAIGGSDAQLFDDGGGNVFSFMATVDSDTSPGGKVLLATIRDTEGRFATTSIGLTVQAAPTQIYQIQGAGHASPLDGQFVSGVDGIVTATGSNGFWMTDTSSDADEATSDGIFVFISSLPTVAAGEAVVVDGTVAEFGFAGGLAITELTSPTVTVESSGNDVPVTDVGTGGRTPPQAVIDDDALSVYEPATDGIDFWESLEGMYVRLVDPIAVGLPRFGEIPVVPGGSQLATPRGGIVLEPGDLNPQRINVDDVLADTPNVINVGDTFTTDVAGPIDYSFGAFKLLTTTDLVRVDEGLTPEVTDASGPHDLAVATFNVENLSAQDSAAKINRLAGQIVNNLRSPDLVAIEEMQDNSGFNDDGIVAADQSWQRLINAIVAAGGPLYDYRQIDPENNLDGGAPGGNIRVGFLFRSDRGLEFVDRPGGHATNDTNVVPTPNGKGAQLTLSPGRVLETSLGDDAAFALTRKSLAGEFKFRGERLFVVVNHFSSKGDDDILWGSSQPPVRYTEFQSGDPEDGWRHAQAQAINDFVDEILAVDANANVIVLGDINDFQFSETVGVLSGVLSALPGGPDADGSGPTAATGADAVLTSLFDLLPSEEQYSYVFDGNSQVLDQILVSQSLLDVGPTYDVVHVNAEFSGQASDHDPSVMRIVFQPRGGGRGGS